MSVKVPTSLLRQTVTVEAYLGDSAVGPVYGSPTTVRARVEGKRRAVRRANGTDVISTASITVRPDVNIPTESRIVAPHPVTGADETFEVLEVITGAGLARPSHFEVLVG